MENEDRIKALNILFSAAVIGFVVTAVLTSIIQIIKPEGVLTSIIIGPVSTYIAGRILCFKEYKD